jgi:hypothetical protein
MCFVLYVGTVNALPRAAWNQDSPSLSVASLTERDAAIRQYFSNPEVQYVGSTSGCGCDFPNAMLQNGSWPTIELDAADKDNFDKAQDISEQHNRELLIRLLQANCHNIVELYGFWIGDKDATTKSPLALENIPLDRIRQPDFRLNDQVFYRVHPESGPGN